MSDSKYQQNQQIKQFILSKSTQEFLTMKYKGRQTNFCWPQSQQKVLTSKKVEFQISFMQQVENAAKLWPAAKSRLLELETLFGLILFCFDIYGAFVFCIPNVWPNINMLLFSYWEGSSWVEGTIIFHGKMNKQTKILINADYMQLCSNCFSIIFNLNIWLSKLKV